ncbi:MAG: hypothetical protein QM750_21950 [Rubrivivax sp.]
MTQKPRRRTRRSASLPRQLTELAIAAPQVVAHRTARLALAGPLPSARDRKEFHGMVAEKQAAFVQSWTGMLAEAWRLQQRLALDAWRGALLPGAWQAAWQVAEKGLQPVHRKATANARRLARTRLLK